MNVNDLLNIVKGVNRKYPNLPFLRQGISLYFYLKNLKIKYAINREYKVLKSQEEKTESRFDFSWKNRQFCYNRINKMTTFPQHYVYHTGWAARKLAENKVKNHTDISSSIFFNAIASAFVEFEYYEFTPAFLNLNNIKCRSADLYSLPFDNNSIHSLSCMHVIEHIGLGRYGDKLNYDGDLIAMKELIRVLAIGGILLFVVPIGRPKIIFNAHRIYSYRQISEYFAELELVEFSLIPDNEREIGMIFNATEQQSDQQKYGCGCFLFRKHS